MNNVVVALAPDVWRSEDSIEGRKSRTEIMTNPTKPTRLNSRCAALLSIWILAVIGVASTLILTMVSDGETATDRKSAEIMNQVVSRGKAVVSLKASVAVTTSYQVDNSTQSVRGFLIYRRPSDFRFQGSGPSGNPLFELILKANHFELYIPTEGKILRGKKACFGRRFPDVAELETLVPLALFQWRNAKFDGVESSDSSKTVLRLIVNRRIWRATLDTASKKLLRLERLTSKSLDLAADFGDFGAGDLDWMPRSFRVVCPPGKWSSLVKIRNMKVNPFLVEKNFQLEPMFSTKFEECK